MIRKIYLALILFILVINSSVLAQNWTNADYKKVLWMTTRFYGAQRSGDDNWVLYNHLPAGVNATLRGKAFRADGTAGGTDLSGGWHDCGDHVKFGQTQFYSAYMLLKGYAEFPAGYDDKYTQTYVGYKAANSWNYEGTAHDPNCIPDVLDEMKHETDYLMKALPNATTFHFQVGRGGCPGDHCQWETAVKMQTETVGLGGNNDNGTTANPKREVYSNMQDASMSSLCGATMALMSRMYRPYDPAYADLCLQYALYAYTYAKANPGTVGSQGGGQYNANSQWQDDLATLCAELFWATNSVAYRTEAINLEPSVNFNAGYTFDYINNSEIALYNLALLGDPEAITRFNNRITGHFLAGGSRNGAGVYTAHGNWGRLRYNANAALLISLYSKLNNNTTAPVINAIYNDIDYIMGKNGSKRSYIVGFTPAAGGPFISPLKPHHRNAYLRDDNPGNGDNSLLIPAKNQQLGALVGGQRDGSYNDERNDYVNSEVCIDYNAGLVGALGFINSRLAPVSIPSNCPGSLPVEFVSLDARQVGGLVEIKWATASESAHAYFEVQRSSNGIDFKSIGKVISQSNSDSYNEYAFIDPTAQFQVVYYRIASYDIDGTVEYTKTVSVFRDVLALSVSPNPSSGRFDIVLGGQFIDKISVSDILGKVVFTSTPNETLTNIDLTQFPAGIYMLTVQYGTVREVVRIVKE